VSSISPEGVRNLAPFSFFNSFSFSPPTLGIGPGSRQGVNKDSLANIRATGEFVVNAVSEELAQLVNLCSAELDGQVDEWDLLGIEGADSVAVAPQRVAAAPAAFECRVLEIVDLGTEEMPSNSLIVGSVLRIHVADEAMNGMTPNPDALGLVGRMGGDEWCRTGDRFTLPRPGTVDQEELRRRAEELRAAR
jgi:flavin reductase (DIM6/NTAB) family NADH-FMN oxidoreductase RutF